MNALNQDDFYLFRTEESPCPYLKEENWIQDFFYAAKLSAAELDNLLAEGWRKFGHIIFRPNCPVCQKCLPLRLETKIFKMSKSQRKLLNKNNTKNITIKYSPPRFREELFDIYTEHSKARFKETDNSISHFKETFFTETAPSIQCEYYVDNKLAALGFLDKGELSLSSVYFCFLPQYSRLSLGTFSALKEIELARELELPYYYLGYWIRENHSMAYKSRFKPFQLRDWKTGKWYYPEQKTEKLS